MALWESESCLSLAGLALVSRLKGRFTDVSLQVSDTFNHMYTQKRSISSVSSACAHEMDAEEMTHNGQK